MVEFTLYAPSPQQGEGFQERNRQNMREERKKTGRTIGLFLLFLLIIMIPTTTIFLVSENHTYQDYRERAELAGTIDYVEIGASHCKRGFVSTIIDEGLGVNSYNLGGESLTMMGRLELLKLELARNPVKTVILELSMDSLSYQPDKKLNNGDLYLVPRIGIPSISIPYLVKISRPWYYGRIFAYFLNTGLDDTRDLLTGHYSMRSSNQKKGYVPHYDDWVKTKAHSLKRLQAVFQTRRRGLALRQFNRDRLDEIIEMCREKDIELIFITVPVSDYWISRFNNLDEPYHYYRELADKNGLEYYDFNLWKGEYDLFVDEEDFYDNGHLGNDGAVKFTNLFVETMQKRAAGEDISQEFYKDYADLYMHMPYASEEKLAEMQAAEDIPVEEDVEE